MVGLLLIGRSIGAQLTPVNSRSHADDATKDGAKVALVAEAHLLADVGHGLFCFGQQRLRPLDTEVVEVGDDFLIRAPTPGPSPVERARGG